LEDEIKMTCQTTATITLHAASLRTVATLMFVRSR
jgi:hypothetical protein